MYHDLIFESAEHVFAAKGFDDATIQEIAAEAGVSLKTLYATFPGKQELYDEIQAVRIGEFVECVTLPLRTGSSPLDKLAGGVRGYVDFLVEHPDYLHIHLREGKAWALKPSGVGREGWELGVGGFAGVIREGIEQGLFYEGDAELLAMTGTAVMQVQMARLAEGASPDDAEQIVEETLTHLTRLFCKPGAADIRAA
jgi:AcrR family transcriptional regulator